MSCVSYCRDFDPNVFIQPCEEHILSKEDKVWNSRCTIGAFAVV